MHKAMSELSQKFDSWNDRLFRRHGVLVRLDLPSAAKPVSAEEVDDVFIIGDSRSPSEIESSTIAAGSTSNLGRNYFKAKLVITPLNETS